MCAPVSYLADIINEYACNVCVSYRARESRGWELIYTTPPLERVPQCIALNARVTATTTLGDRMLAALLGLSNEYPLNKCHVSRFHSGTEVKVWSCSPLPKLLSKLYQHAYFSLFYSVLLVASFDMKMSVDGLLFANNQLVAISNTGKVAIWQSVQKHWQVGEHKHTYMVKVCH